LNKILILRDNLWSDANQKVNTSNENVDLLSFDSIGELPQNFSSDIYIGLFLLVNKISAEAADYVRKLRLFNCDQVIFILGTITSKEVYTRILDVENCFIFEKSTYSGEQYSQLLLQLQNISIKQQKFQQNLLNTKLLLANSPEIIVTINKNGKITAVNKSFLSTFKYPEIAVVNKNIDNFIPGYSFEDFIYIVENPDESNRLVSTFIDGNGELKPVVINILKSPQSNNDYYIYIKNRSEVLTYKRILEHQNNCFSELTRLFENVFQLNDHHDNERLINNIKNVFNSDLVINCPLKLSTYSNKYVIDFDSLAVEEVEVIQVLKGIIDNVVKKPLISTLQFFEENESHKDIIDYAKTITFIPVESNTINSIILLLYVNRYDPDGFIKSLYSILKEILSYKAFQNIPTSKGSEFNQNFKTIIENVLPGIYQATIDGKVIYANPSFIKIMGFSSSSEFLKSDIVLNLFKDERMALYKTLKEKRSVQEYKTSLKTKKGEFIHIVEDSHIIKNENNNEVIVGVIRREPGSNQPANFKISEAFTEELVEKSNIIITVKDPSGIYTYWNRQAEKVTGYSKTEVLGKHSLGQLLYPDEKYRDFVKRKFEEYFYENSNSQIELSLWTKNGTEKKISWTAIKIGDDKKSYKVFFGIDVTSVKLLEKRFHEKKQMDVFNSVTEKIAQQFKNQISALSKSIVKIKETSTVDSYTAIREAEKNLRQANQFSDQILNLSGKQQASAYELLEPNEIIENSIHNIIEKTIPDTVKLNVRYNSAGFIKINEAQLNKILLNLVLNAVDAIDGKGQIQIETYSCLRKDEPFLIQNNAVNNEYLKLNVADNGRGMSPEEKSRIFEPFFSTDKSRKGLGATIIFNVVHEANGFVNVESKLGEGTKITIYLPLHKGEKNKIEKPKSSKSKILIVDDQKVIREFLNDMASTDGYTTILAEDGKEGLRAYESNYKDIGLVILDIIMPKMYGNDVFYKMKKINPDLKVLVISGHIDPKIKKQLIEDGVDGYLPKPFDVQTTREQIRALLS
jgi:PAS domain S-box-containing protein